MIIYSIRVRLIFLVVILLLTAGVLTCWVVDQNRSLQIEKSSAQLLGDARQARSELQSEIRALV